MNHPIGHGTFIVAPPLQYPLQLLLSNFFNRLLRRNTLVNYQPPTDLPNRTTANYRTPNIRARWPQVDDRVPPAPRPTPVHCRAPSTSQPPTPVPRLATNHRPSMPARIQATGSLQPPAVQPPTPVRSRATVGNQSPAPVRRRAAGPSAISHRADTDEFKSHPEVSDLCHWIYPIIINNI